MESTINITSTSQKPGGGLRRNCWFFIASACSLLTTSGATVRRRFILLLSTMIPCSVFAYSLFIYCLTKPNRAIASSHGMRLHTKSLGRDPLLDDSSRFLPGQISNVCIVITLCHPHRLSSRKISLGKRHGALSFGLKVHFIFNFRMWQKQPILVQCFTSSLFGSGQKDPYVSKASFLLLITLMLRRPIWMRSWFFEIRLVHLTLLELNDSELQIKNLTQSESFFINMYFFLFFADSCNGWAC